MKNTVVLKDIDSNLVEEAIIVFRENVKIKEKQLVKGNKDENIKDCEKEKIALEEAENVILDYIKETEESRKRDKQKKKMRVLKSVNIFLVGLLILAIIF